jgi:hypothetical protein
MKRPRPSRHDGWAARRRIQREQDLDARKFGYRDYRCWQHASSVERLREILCSSADDAAEELFETRVVADAIGGTSKVIRALAHSRMIMAEKLPGPKARKLFFTAGSLRKYLDSCRHVPSASLLGRPEYCGAFHSEKICVNRKFARGEVVTKARAAIELRVSLHQVEYYIRRKQLTKLPSSNRTTLISRKSLAKLSWDRINKAETELRSAREKLAFAERRQKNICGE